MRRFFPKLLINGRYFVFLFFCFNINSASSQDIDWGIWSELGMVKKSNKWQFAGLLEIRTQDQSKQFDRISLILDPRYKITNWLSAGLAYQPMVKWAENSPELRHRHYYYIINSFTCQSFTFSLRERMEYTHKPGATEYDSWDMEGVWRNQMRVNKKIPNKPYYTSLWLETFAPVNTGNFKFNEYRYALSFTYLSKERRSVQSFVMIDDRLTNKLFVIGLNYYFLL